jgi:hypothetical protein
MGSQTLSSELTEDCEDEDAGCEKQYESQESESEAELELLSSECCELLSDQTEPDKVAAVASGMLQGALWRVVKGDPYASRFILS